MSGNGFKFGRGYHWTHVNLDFLSMYGHIIPMADPTEQIGMLLGVPPQYIGREERGMISQRNENMQRNNERDTIVLTRRDLSRGKFGYTKNMIDSDDFSQQSMSRQEFMRSSIVIFMDDDGTTKTLKNRYGRTN